MLGHGSRAVGEQRVLEGRATSAPTRMYHSVPHTAAKASGGMERKNDVSVIWLAWASMARRLWSR